MYDIVASQFAGAMQREGKIINSYTDNTAYNVLFRKNSDKNTMTNRITIFYPVTENILQGQLLNYKDKVYLAVNKETAENEVYYKSDLLQTNTSIFILSIGSEYELPIYSYDIKNYLEESNSVLSVASGNLEMITTDNTVSRALDISNTFDAMGATWEIQNLIYKDGIAHIYVKRTTSSSNTYTLTINANNSYGINTTSQLTATAKYGDTVITDATIEWTSSDTNIATIDNNGNASFIASGCVNITALWVEHNVSATKAITVNSHSVYITANDTYSTSDTPTLTATAKINEVVDNTATFTWSSSDTTKATIDSNTGSVTFLSAGTVTFTATWTQQNAIGTKQVEITAPIPTTLYTCKITNTTASPKVYNDTDNIAQCKVGGTLKPFMCHFYDQNNVEVTTLTPSWSINVSSLSSEYQSKVHLTYNESYPLRAYLNVDDDDLMIDMRFQLTLTDTENLCAPTTIPVDITAYM